MNNIPDNSVVLIICMYKIYPLSVVLMLDSQYEIAI